MAQHGQFSINPMVSIAGNPQYQADTSAGVKRRREEGDGFNAYTGGLEESAPKRQAKAQDVLFRIVVPSRQVGKVIGQGGKRIQKIREDTKATIKIADAIAVSFLSISYSIKMLKLSFSSRFKLNSAFKEKPIICTSSATKSV